MNTDNNKMSDFFTNLPSGTFELRSTLQGLNLLNIIKIPDDSCDLFSLFPTLDNCIGKLYEGDLIIVAAKKGVGKTSFATTITHFAARNLSTTCFVAFFDTDFIDYSQRFLVTESRTNINHLILENILPSDINKTLEATRNLKETNITLYSDPLGSIEKLQKEVLIWAETYKKTKKLIFIDTIQFIAFADNSRLTILEVTRALKKLAQDSNSILIFTTNVDPATPDSRAPQMKDFNGGPEFANEADVVISLNHFKSTSTLTVLKNRNKNSSLQFPLIFEERWQTWSPI